MPTKPTALLFRTLPSNTTPGSLESLAAEICNRGFDCEFKHEDLDMTTITDPHTIVFVYVKAPETIVDLKQTVGQNHPPVVIISAWGDFKFYRIRPLLSLTDIRGVSFKPGTFYYINLGALVAYSVS